MLTLFFFSIYSWCLCVINCDNSKNWCGNLPSGTLPANIIDHKTCDWAVYYRKFDFIYKSIVN